jgi:hypothetical protein
MPRSWEAADLNETIVQALRVYEVGLDLCPLYLVVVLMASALCLPCASLPSIPVPSFAHGAWGVEAACEA